MAPAPPASIPPATPGAGASPFRPAAPAPTGQPRPSGGAAVPPSSPTATPSRAPINPFLANDPNAKARRLARALVSDLVTYFPEKREQGLREGTLKQLYKEEIQKSFEEYVAQVGREFAESTTHFQDALNDILANGQRLF